MPFFYEIPEVQDLFYSPFSQSDASCTQSPLLRSLRITNIKELPQFSHASAHTAADSKADPTGNVMLPEMDISQSLCSLIKKLNIQATSKNLEELLQRSFSAQTHSALQSPRGSTLHSPFVLRTNFQGKMPGSTDASLLKNNSFRKSPFANPSQNLRSQTTADNDEAFLLQIANLINQEQDGRIKMAISELIATYSKDATGKETANRRVIFSDKRETSGNANEQGKPKTILLSNGMTLNALERSPKATSYTVANLNFKANPQNTKIEAARKELFVISENVTKQEQQKLEQPEFNLFDSIGTARSNPSPLISSGSLFNQNLSGNLFNNQPYPFLSHLSTQAVSLSTNSSNNGGQKIKQANANLLDKQLFNRIFSFNDDLLMQGKALENKLHSSEHRHSRTGDQDSNIKTPGNKNSKSNAKVIKKQRNKVNKITAEEYIQHVTAREESIIAINEGLDESGDWDDIESSIDEKPDAR